MTILLSFRTNVLDHGTICNKLYNKSFFMQNNFKNKIIVATVTLPLNNLTKKHYSTISSYCLEKVSR